MSAWLVIFILAVGVMAGVLAGVIYDTWHDHTPPDPCEDRPRFRYRPPGW